MVTWETVEENLIGNKVEYQAWKGKVDCVSIIQAETGQLAWKIVSE